MNCKSIFLGESVSKVSEIVKLEVSTLKVRFEVNADEGVSLVYRSSLLSIVSARLYKSAVPKALISTCKVAELRSYGRLEESELRLLLTEHEVTIAERRNPVKINLMESLLICLDEFLVYSFLNIEP